MKNLVYLFLLGTLAFGCKSEDDEIVNVKDSTAVVVYNENNQTDLSNNSNEPTVITAFSSGNNRVISNQGSGDVDYFTFIVPEGYELSEINLESYDADPAFIGIAIGETVPGNMAPDLLGGVVYSRDLVGTNVLPEIGRLQGATGFTGALPSGQYSIWLNQTEDAVTQPTFDFVIVKQ